MFLYLLSISLLFHLVYIAVFGVAFLYSGSLWFLFIAEVPHCHWVRVGLVSSEGVSDCVTHTHGGARSPPFARLPSEGGLCTDVGVVLVMRGLW